jgi:hypothetical protein
MTVKAGIIITVVLVLAFIVYRCCGRRNRNVDPHARREIEKAKRR